MGKRGPRCERPIGVTAASRKCPHGSRTRSDPRAFFNIPPYVRRAFCLSPICRRTLAANRCSAVQAVGPDHFLRKPARSGVRDPLTGQESVVNQKKALQVMFAGPFACRFLFPLCLPNSRTVRPDKRDRPLRPDEVSRADHNPGWLIQRPRLPTSRQRPTCRLRS